MFPWQDISCGFLSAAEDAEFEVKFCRRNNTKIGCLHKLYYNRVSNGRIGKNPAFPFKGFPNHANGDYDEKEI